MAEKNLRGSTDKNIVLMQNSHLGETIFVFVSINQTMSFLSGLTGKASSGDAATSAIGLESGLVCIYTLIYFKSFFFLSMIHFTNVLYVLYVLGIKISSGEKWLPGQTRQNESIQLEEEIFCVEWTLTHVSLKCLCE